MDQQPVFDEEQCAEYIFSKLVERGMVADRESIMTILSLEFEYMQSIGLA